MTAFSGDVGTCATEGSTNGLFGYRRELAPVYTSLTSKEGEEVEEEPEEEAEEAEEDEEEQEEGVQGLRETQAGSGR